MEKFMGGEEQEKKENSGYGERLREICYQNGNGIHKSYGNLCHRRTGSGNRSGTLHQISLRAERYAGAHGGIATASAEG